VIILVLINKYTHLCNHETKKVIFVFDFENLGLGGEVEGEGVDMKCYSKRIQKISIYDNNGSNDISLRLIKLEGSYSKYHTSS